MAATGAMLISRSTYEVAKGMAEQDTAYKGGGWRRTVGGVCDGVLMMVVFDAELWIWDARRSDSWTFVSLPVEVSEDIRDLAPGSARGFGSLRVRVTVGDTSWKTSIFPDSARKSYVLPIKRAVRVAEGISAGDSTTVTIELIGL